MTKRKVAILGATGMVGQKFVQLLSSHPWFEIAAVMASDRSVGKRYGDACRWAVAGHSLPAAAGDLTVLPCQPAVGVELYLSALPADIAGGIEADIAIAGFPVISNSSSHRMDDDVPILVPEVNPSHLGALTRQRTRWGQRNGFIVTNPNCTVAGLAVALDALHQAFGIKRVMVATLQALSGAGYPGVPALDMIDNIIPYIANEEEKVETEPQKILGVYDGSTFVPAPFTISAHCHRVSVRDGHTESISIEYLNPPTLEQAAEVLAAYRGNMHDRALPTAPELPIMVRTENDRPQPRFDRSAGNGMTVTVGRLRACKLFHHRLVLLSDNMMRGAAGAAVLNAELLVSMGIC